MISSAFVSAILMSQKLRLQTTLITVLDFELVFSRTPVSVWCHREKDMPQLSVSDKPQSSCSNLLFESCKWSGKSQPKGRGGLKRRWAAALFASLHLISPHDGLRPPVTTRKLLREYIFFRRNQCFIYWSLGLFNGSLTGLILGSERTDQLPQIHWK